jgi:DNA-binding beta-propeller fold protein YncE
MGIASDSARSAIALVAGLAVSLALLGCGNTYRPVVAAINPVGPAGQPTKYALAVSSPAQTSATQSCPATPSSGLVTIVDFSGDTVLITASLSAAPYYFNLNAGGNTGYTLNCDKTMNSFDISTQLISSNVLFTTLLPGANPVSILPLQTNTYIADPGVNAIDQLTGTPPALKQELPVGTNPVYVTGINTSARYYALNQGAPGSAGTVSAIEAGNNAISATLPVGKGPIYGVMDGKRAYILNQTDGTVTVINIQTNGLDSFPNTSGTGLTSTIPVGVSPVWADFAPTHDELVVANGGNGTSAGSVSIVNIPLCSTLALATNPTCDANNPVDATGFGQTIATVPVGINPIMVSVLSDGTRAYVANAGPGLHPCAAPGTAPVAGQTEACTVSVVNLTSNTVTATIPVYGHPIYLAATNSTPTGKVYVVAKDSTVMTVIETDTDSVDTTIPLQGYGVSVRVTAP